MFGDGTPLLSEFFSYVAWFMICTGKSSKAEVQPALLMSGNVVYRLTRTLPRNVIHKVFFADFFSSIALMNCLKKDAYWAFATICFPSTALIQEGGEVH